AIRHKLPIRLRLIHTPRNHKLNATCAPIKNIGSCVKSPCSSRYSASPHTAISKEHRWSSWELAGCQACLMASESKQVYIQRMSTQTTQTQETSAPARSSFRPELQGLRALAVGLVLLFHLWPSHVSGGFVGVAVFFVVSGFLITGHLYRELSSTGTIALSKFWARRVMRLLPLAFTVLVFSVIAMLFFVPQTVWGMNVRQILGSLFYVENWVLAADSVDYMAAENEPSLVQHYWSLSIEEQFYIVLPLLLLGTYLLTKFLRKNQQGTGINTQKIFIWALLGITVATFIFSVLYTNYNAAQAYFVTPTRFWDFSIGGLLAMLPAATKIPNQLQHLLGWAGTIAIVTAALAYDGNTAFPGYTALLPVIGAALFL